MVSHDWSSGLPNHLIEYVLHKLDSCKDVLQFACVSQNWHSTAKTFPKDRIANPPPMLLVGDERDTNALWSFNVSETRFLTSKLSVPYEKRFCGSSRHGWLAAVNQDWSVTLHNPFSSSSSSNVIVLPPVFPPSPEYLASPTTCLPKYYPYHVQKLVISSDPVENRDECVVVAFLWIMRDLAVFRMSCDSSWIIVKNPGLFTIPQDLMMVSNTRVYAVGCCGDILSVDLDHVDRDSVLVLQPSPKLGLDINNYLVQSRSGENIYLVQRFFKKLPEGVLVGRSTVKFKVFSVDLATGKYEKVRSVGDDDALFLGDNTSVCVKASSGVKANCIYFTHDVDLNSSSRRGVSDVGIYDIRTKEFKARYAIPEVTYRAMGKRPPIFVFPALLL